MNTDALLDSLRKALAACTNPRLFQTERGFQGQLLVELSNRINLPNQTIIEQEYQKRLHTHGLNIRPDIVVHEPYDPYRHADRTDGNIAVIELKLNASADQAAEDFANLAKMLTVLQYTLGVFININSSHTHALLIPQAIRDRVVAYAVSPGDVSAIVLEERA
jgi:hypothetical protein